MGLLEVLNTPERREQSRRQQTETREKLGSRLAYHPAQANYLYGLARQQQALDLLAALPVDTDDDRREIFLIQLGEGLALQARFEEAAVITESEPHRAEYVAKAEALKNIGSGCQCPAVVVKPSPTNAKGTAEKTRQPIEHVFDGKAVITMTKCLLCGKFAAEIG